MVEKGKEKCAWQCEHFECPSLCSEPCNRPPCNEPCKKLLRCKHKCIGLCGETCPQWCRICTPDAEEAINLMTLSEFDPKDCFIQLIDCNHVFEVSTLDNWMTTQSESEAVQLPVCPQCKTPIRRTFR